MFKDNNDFTSCISHCYSLLRRTCDSENRLSGLWKLLVGDGILQNLSIGCYCRWKCLRKARLGTLAFLTILWWGRPGFPASIGKEGQDSVEAEMNSFCRGDEMKCTVVMTNQSLFPRDFYFLLHKKRIIKLCMFTVYGRLNSMIVTFSYKNYKNLALR